jgi:hypothetical protein
MRDAIPGSIVTAICKVQKSMTQAVAKTEKNPHGGWYFMSTDQLYAKMQQHMANAGLVIICLEDEKTRIERVEVKDKITQWAKFHFKFVLATETDSWTDETCRRTLMIQVTGPQTFGAAESYATKAFLRSTFKIPSGEVDLDMVAQADAIEDQVDLNTPKPKAKRKSSYGAKKDGTTEKFNEIVGKLRAAESPDELTAVKQNYAKDWQGMPTEWEIKLNDEWEESILKMGRNLV